MLRIALLTVLLLPFIVFSQTTATSIEGIIVNPRLEPIPNATIKIIANDTNGVVKKFVFANEEGKFKILVPTTTYKLYLQISSIGYTNYNVLVTYSITGKYYQFIIEPLTKELPEVHVLADQGITKRGDTTSFKVSAFVKGNENNIADLIKRLPGFKIDETGSMSYNGKKIAAVLVEDDDLFGSNYGNLVNNASINGIEKVEVIENYKDRSKLENSLTQGKQTVVNLKYKNLGIKNFGEAKLGYAPNKDLLDTKFSNTTLSKRIKGITIANKNQVGFLAQKLFGLDSEKGLPQNKNIEYPTEINNITTPIGINNIQPNNINSYRLFDNNSSLITTNLLIKPAKKILFKNNYASVNDYFLQNYNSITTYLNTVLPTIVNEQSNLQKNNHYFFTEGELSINWREKMQTRVYYVIANGNNNHLSNGFFQSNPSQQLIQNNNKQTSSMLTHIVVLNATSYLNFKYAYNCAISSSNYQFNNPIIDSMFKITSASKQLVQNLTYNQYTHILGVTWYKSIKQIAMDVTYNSTFKNVLPTNNAYTKSYTNDITPLTNDFLLQQQINCNENELSINLSKKLSKKLSTKFTSKHKYITYNYGLIDSKTKKTELLWLPSFQITWQPTNKQALSLSGSLNSVLPTLDQLNRAMVFTTINTISSGANAANIQRGYNASVFYLFHDPIEKKIMLNVFANYTNMPNIYNNNFTSRGLYALYALTPSYNNNSTSLLVAVSVDKNLVAIKSWLKLNVSTNYNTSFSNTNYLLTTNKFISIKSELRFSTNWNKWFNITTSVANIINKQQSVIAGLFENNFISQDWIANTTIELKFNDKWFVDIQHDYLTNQSFNQPKRQIQFLDTKFRYNITNKWAATFILRNMLNTDEFSTNNASITKNVVQNFELTSFIALLSVGYKF